MGTKKRVVVLSTKGVPFKTVLIPDVAYTEEDFDQLSRLCEYLDLGMTILDAEEQPDIPALGRSLLDDHDLTEKAFDKAFPDWDEVENAIEEAGKDRVEEDTCRPGCMGFLHMDEPFEIERCDECGRFQTDDEAREAHEVECKCGWPLFDWHSAAHAWLQDVLEIYNDEPPKEVEELHSLLENRGVDFLDGIKNGNIVRACTRALDLAPPGSAHIERLRGLMSLLKKLTDKVEKGEVDLDDVGYSEDWSVCAKCEKPLPADDAVEVMGTPFHQECLS